MTSPTQPTPLRPEPRRAVVREFFAHLLRMPRWHKTVLTIAMALLAAGVAGHASHLFQRSDDLEQSWLARHAPTLTRVGFGCIAGFLVGWLFRAFLKLMSLLALAGAVLFTGLSYFSIMNVDFSAAKGKYNTSIAWVSDQAGRIKDGLLAHVPASASSLAGMFLGFRRRK